MISGPNASAGKPPAKTRRHQCHARFSEGRGTDPAQDDNVEANTMTMTTAPILAMLAANGLPEACGGLPAADVRLGTTP